VVIGRPPLSTSIAFPLLKIAVFDLGWFFVALAPSLSSAPATP